MRWKMSLMVTICGAASAAALLLVPLPASAVEVLDCTVRAIHGLEKQGGIDKRLADLTPHFNAPPFAAFKTLQLLQTSALKAPQESAQLVTLPSGMILRLTYKEKVLAHQGKVRLRLKLSITPPKKKGFLPGTLYTVAEGGVLFVGGEAFQDGRLMVAVSCRANK